MHKIEVSPLVMILAPKFDLPYLAWAMKAIGEPKCSAFILEHLGEHNVIVIIWLPVIQGLNITSL